MDVTTTRQEAPWQNPESDSGDAESGRYTSCSLSIPWIGLGGTIMALSGISPIANTGPGLSVLNPAASVSASSAKPVTSVSAVAPVAAAAPAPASSTPAPPAKPAAPRTGGGGGGASSGSIQQLVTDTYTTTVAGKSYSGSVQQQPGGGFIASVPSVPGASASGSTALAAETALGTIIDALA
jgi:hypothetical protein